MIIVAQGFTHIKDGLILFSGSEDIPCPVCGGRLFVHGTCRRKLRSGDDVDVYRLRVMECRDCGRTHRELPENMVPYKRMDISNLVKITQAAACEHLETAETSTWKRVCAWVNWFLWYSQQLLESLRVCRPGYVTNPIGCSAAGQLAYFVRLAANSGNWIQHRSVQTIP